MLLRVENDFLAAFFYAGIKIVGPISKGKDQVVASFVVTAGFPRSFILFDFFFLLHVIIVIIIRWCQRFFLVDFNWVDG